MSEILDARGLACPEPVLMARRALEAGHARIEILVDNKAARQNILRFAKNSGCTAECAEQAGDFRLTLGREGGK